MYICFWYIGWHLFLRAGKGLLCATFRLQPPRADSVVRHPLYTWVFVIYISEFWRPPHNSCVLIQGSITFYDHFLMAYSIVYFYRYCHSIFPAFDGLCFSRQLVLQPWNFESLISQRSESQVLLKMQCSYLSFSCCYLSLTSTVVRTTQVKGANTQVNARAQYRRDRTQNRI